MMPMKKRYYRIIILFFLAESILIALSFFLRFAWLNSLVNLVITIPASVGLTYLVNAIIWGPRIKRFPEYKTPAVESKDFLKAQSYVCEECGEFLYRFSEICENCGAKNSLRKSTKLDYITKVLDK